MRQSIEIIFEAEFKVFGCWVSSKWAYIALVDSLARAVGLHPKVFRSGIQLASEQLS
jgi:hypothetical protein